MLFSKPPVGSSSSCSPEPAAAAAVGPSLPSGHFLAQPPGDRAALETVFPLLCRPSRLFCLASKFGLLRGSLFLSFCSLQTCVKFRFSWIDTGNHERDGSN